MLTGFRHLQMGRVSYPHICSTDFKNDSHESKCIERKSHGMQHTAIEKHQRYVTFNKCRNTPCDSKGPFRQDVALSCLVEGLCETDIFGRCVALIF